MVDFPLSRLISLITRRHFHISPPIPKPQLVIHSDSITSSNWVCHLFALVLYIILPIEITTTCPKMSIPHFFSSAIYFQHPNLAGALRGQAIQVIQVSSLGAPGWPAALQLFHDLLGEVGAEACASDGNCHWGWMVFWAKVDRKPLNFRCFYEARFKVWVRFFFLFIRFCEYGDPTFCWNRVGHTWLVMFGANPTWRGHDFEP